MTPDQYAAGCASSDPQARQATVGTVPVDARSEALVRLVAAARMADHAAAGRVDVHTAAAQMRVLLDAADFYLITEAA